MKIHMLGTAAAEGFPALFCRCKHCARARELGGRNMRTRSSVIIDDCLKVDFPPDTLYHVHRDGIDLGSITEMIVTHTHLDHLQPVDLEMRLPVYAHETADPLTIYGHDAVIRACKSAVSSAGERLAFKLIQPFQTFETSTARITALPANHDPNETCLLYLIERGGKTLFYCHDTGLLPDSVWDYLQNNNVKLDAIIMDSTNGNFPFTGGHMNIEAVIGTKNRMFEQGILHEQSTVIATHFSHNIGLMQEDLEAIYSPEGIVTAYDGMIIHI
ncbi:MBL fold metallo-hydrolase [Paenibacillus thermotolerans]|uniref:MBL fold metallo-hydrolase n=1 Tax=Paenibacillus thermotolerans TaxID=3027807 RepID=UPI0023685DF0|nr:MULTISPECIES: MBL fold metallo-hydrolase [unclassified Paenibacillus]